MLNTINVENTDQYVGGVETQLHRKTRTTYHAGLENNVAILWLTSSAMLISGQRSCKAATRK